MNMKPKFDLNEFRSQSVQDRETFLNTYHNTKLTSLSSSKVKIELDSKIIDLNRRLTRKLQINETSSPIQLELQSNTAASSSIPISSGCSSINDGLSIVGSGGGASAGNMITSNGATPNSFVNNNNGTNQDESSFFDSIYDTTNERLTSNDEDYKSQYSESNDIMNSFPCMTLSNRIDELVPSASNGLFNNHHTQQQIAKQQHQSPINDTSTATSISTSATPRVRFNNNTTFKDSDDFIFLPEDLNTERYSILSYEVLSKSDGLHIDYTIHIKEFPHTTIENQSFKCAECKTQVQSMRHMRRCHYFGKLYCKICHQNDKYVIPAKLIKCFDTKKYTVCVNAKYMLDTVYRRGIFDIIYDNADLYNQSTLLNDCKQLRIQLEHIKNYLHTCKNKQVYNVFIMYLWPDDYLYDSRHLYSLYDLINLKDVFVKLKSACDYGIKHILKECEVCQQKGFFCELCKYDKVIYPFQLTITMRCEDCGTIYHKECRLKANECPKCKRIASRK